MECISLERELCLTVNYNPISGEVNISLVKCHFLVHCDFVVMTEEVGNTFKGGGVVV